MSDSNASFGNILFIGACGKVVALDRFDGSILWRWKATEGGGFWASLVPSSFTSIAVDGDRLIVATPKCIWCLDPLTGAEVWTCRLKDLVRGYPIIASASNADSTAAAGSLIAAQKAAMGAAAAGGAASAGAAG